MAGRASRSVQPPAPPPYPWAQLYNVESNLHPSRQPSVHKRGRPARLIPRKKTLLELTDSELRLLRRLTNRTAEVLYPGKVSRSQIIGLALQMLEAQFASSNLPEPPTDWNTLVAALHFRGKAEEDERPPSAH